MNSIIEWVSMLGAISFGGFAFFVLLFSKMQLRTEQWMVIGFCICVGLFCGAEWLKRKQVQVEPSMPPARQPPHLQLVRTPVSQRDDIESYSEQVRANPFDVDAYINEQVQRKLVDTGLIGGATFDANPNLPDLMNAEAQLIDNLFDERWGIGFYFNMQRSVATPDFWLYAMRETKFSRDDKLKRKQRDMLPLLPEIKRHIAEYRDDHDIDDEEITIAIQDSSRLYLQVSRPDRQIITLESIAAGIQLEPQTLFFGQGYAGPRLVDMTLDLRQPEQWSAAIVAGSGSGKSVGLKVALILYMLNTSPDETDIYIGEHLPKRELAHFAYAPHVKGYFNTQRGYVALLDHLRRHFEDVSEGHTEKRRILLVSDEHPQFIMESEPVPRALRQMYGDNKFYGPFIRDELISFSQIYRSFGFSLLIVSQSGRTDVLPGAMRTNVKGYLVGKSQDSNAIKENLGLTFDLEQLRGNGDFVFKSAGKEQRFKTPLIDIIDDGKHPESEDRRWVDNACDRWGGPTDWCNFDDTYMTMDEMASIEPVSPSWIPPTIQASVPGADVPDYVLDIWHNIHTYIDEIWDFEEMDFKRKQKVRAVQLATNTNTTSTSYHAPRVVEAIEWALENGYIEFEES